MKSVIVFIAALLTLSTTVATAKESVEIAPRKTLSLDYETYAGKSVKIFNRSGSQVEVAAVDKATGKQVKGFGLPRYGAEVLFINDGLVLTLRNTSRKSMKVDLKIVETPAPPKPTNEVYITFTMRNNSAKSIPLVIPNVMNPNLSPFSNSGVRLKIGQEVFFKHKGRKKVLFVVDDSIQDGDKLDISALVRKRKEELKNQ